MINVRVTGCDVLAWDKIKALKANDLKPVDDRDVKVLKTAIKKQGFCFPFFVWAGNDYIIDGAGRVKALLELEAEGELIPSLPIVSIRATDMEADKQLVLMASSRHGDITQESFDLFIDDIDYDAISDSINLDFEPLAVEVLEPLTDEDDVPEPPKEAVSKLGDVYQLGNHRLMCGDATSITDVEKLMDGQKAELIND
ncbi:MAG: hypothetical protein EBR82_10075 [Caulobacteraceae bacterium]|nr:hypothetical protein [Caulobacteraceae bacterium]